jgi:hypothetical protein
MPFTPAAEGHACVPKRISACRHGLWPACPDNGRDVAPLGRKVGATGFTRGAPRWPRNRRADEKVLDLPARSPALRDEGRAEPLSDQIQTLQHKEMTVFSVRRMIAHAF